MPTTSSNPKAKDGVIYVVDDDEAMRESLFWLLESNGFKVSCHENAERFLQALTSTDPTTVSCALLDVRMPGMSGIELQQMLMMKGYQIPVTVMTGHGEVKLAVQAIKQGAVDFLQKPFKNDQICALVEKMLEKAYMEQQKNLEVLTAQSKLKSLTKRENEVLKGLVDGCTNKQVGESLKISLKTVEAHRANVMEKLGVNRAASLLKLAITHTN
jgi:FixJ family two-component response regulator